MKIIRTINGQEIAIELTTEEMLQVYSELDEEYLREDIQQWAEDNGKTVDDELLENILGELNKNYDSNSSLWDNIAANYNWFVWLRNNK